MLLLRGNSLDGQTFILKKSVPYNVIIIYNVNLFRSHEPGEMREDDDGDGHDWVRLRVGIVQTN